MKITNVTTAVIESNFDWTIVKVETDERITGYGEAFLGPGLPAIIKEFSSVILGEDPASIDRIMRRLRGRCVHASPGLTMHALGGIEAAVAITRNRYGKGTLTYEGTLLSDELQAKVTLQVLELAGLTGPDQKLPAPVRVKHGTSNAGRPVHYFLNYSGQPQTFAYAYESGADVLTGKAVAEGASVTLAPWDVAIIEAR